MLGAELGGRSGYLDIKKSFESILQGLLVKAVRRRCQTRLMLLYIERWLKAALQKAGRSIGERTKGIGSIIGPVLDNLYLYYRRDKWFEKRMGRLSI